MRFNNKNGKSAHDIINDYSEQELTRVFVDYAEFSISKAQEIAMIIIKERKNKKIETTFELKNLLNQVGLGQKASTVIFQAIRIETNKEIDNLKLMLDQLPNILSN
jgi:16S rRNA (cytosine1402-N4)-methyltransferase